MQRRQSEDSSSLRDLINKRDKQAKGNIVISCSPCCFFRLCGREGSNVRFKFVRLCVQRATGFFVGTTRNIRSTETGYYLHERWSLFFADIAYLSRSVIFGVPESRHTFFFFWLVSRLKVPFALLSEEALSRQSRICTPHPIQVGPQQSKEQQSTVICHYTVGPRNRVFPLTYTCEHTVGFHKTQLEVPGK